ncbi:MAG: flagellar brake protein [Natronospirillum sp.]|uniref:flagellar brake protein n=1 Tax=Natronospirillum sp. TaxID=2812955 RepID=UPI0025DF111E|nr:flagellar brake protein [Natronospirillum sp.]MCH8551660.1 flagellar brake protein [Natronospirillum sp.]
MEQRPVEQKADAEGEFIQTPSEINRLFSRVKEKLSPVTLRFPGMQRAMTSYILGIDPKLRYILLDEVLPKADNRIMQEGGRSLTIETYYDGCRLRAKDLKVKTLKEDGNLSYRIDFPAEVHYLQRRASYRAQVRRSLEIPARMLDINRQVVNGLLRDLSAEGCQVQIIGDYVDVLKPHDKAIPLKFYFPNGTSLVLKAELRFVGFDENGGFTKCGCQFAQLDTHKEREISRVVTDLQRDFINFTKHGGNPEGIPPLFLPPEVDEDIAALDGKPPPTQSATRAEESRKARDARRARRHTDPERVDIRRTVLSSVAAVKSLIGSARLKQDIPAEELRGAATQLALALYQDREALLVHTHIRNTTDFIFEHPVSLAILFADQASQMNRQLDQDALRDLIFAGLCHDVPRALLPDGEKETGVEVSQDKRTVLKKHINEICHALKANDAVPKDTAMLVAQSWERLDGSGLPEGLKEQQMHPMGKLIACLDAIDTAAHLYRSDVYYNPAVAYKRALSMPEQFDNTLVKRIIMAQGLFPLGAPVRLDNGYLGMVMRHNAQRKPRIVRLVYHLADESQVPPRDIDIEENGVSVKGPVDSLRHDLSATLLQSPLQIP